jgi:hypothetical protein
MKLYEITNEMRELADAFHNEEDEEVLESIKMRFISREIDLDRKLESCARVLGELDGSIATLDLEEQRIAGRRRTLQNNRDWLFRYIGKCLGEGTKRKTPLFSFSWRKSASVNISDEALVPALYMREKVERSPDKKQIAEDLKAGAEIPGCSLEERHSLQIK